MRLEELAAVDSNRLISPSAERNKAAIAEVKNLYDSRIAEQDILQQSAIRDLLGGHPAEADEVIRPFRLERERLASERDAKMEGRRMTLVLQPEHKPANAKPPAPQTGNLRNAGTSAGSSMNIPARPAPTAPAPVGAGTAPAAR